MPARFFPIEQHLIGAVQAWNGTRHAYVWSSPLVPRISCHAVMELSSGVSVYPAKDIAAIEHSIARRKRYAQVPE